MWGDGANQLTAALKVEENRLMGAERQLIRDIQTEFLENRCEDSSYFSKVRSKVVSLTNFEITYR